MNLNNLTNAPSFSSAFFNFNENAASITPNINNINNSINELEATTTAESTSTTSSFSTGLNNIYGENLQENFFLPFFSQQAAAVFQQNQQQNNLVSNLNTESFAKTVHSLLSKQSQNFSAFNLQNANTKLPLTLFDIDSTKLQLENKDLTQFNTNNLATSLPSMNLLLNNFILNKTYNKAIDEMALSKQNSTFGSSVPLIDSMNEKAGKIFFYNLLKC